MSLHGVISRDAYTGNAILCGLIRECFLLMYFNYIQVQVALHPQEFTCTSTVIPVVMLSVMLKFDEKERNDLLDINL